MNRSPQENRRARLTLLLAASVCVAGYDRDSQAHEHTGSANTDTRCSGYVGLPDVRCGNVPTIAIDQSGRFWATFEFDGGIYVSKGEIGNADFGPAVRVNYDSETVDTTGETRPKLAFGSGGELYLSWTQRIAGGYNGDIRFSRSLDGGQSFDKARTINDDGLVTGHRFDTLFVDTQGDVYLAWIDKRDLRNLPDTDREHAGAAVYYTVSTDRGTSFAGNRKVADSSCECCRIAAAATPDHGIALFFRQIFDRHTRDHGIAVVDTNGIIIPPTRATRDGWQIDACPHHGPAMLSAANDTYHLAWFTGGENRKGIYYGHFDARSATLDNVSLISDAASAGHPTFTASEDRLLLAWKEFDGQSTIVNVVQSLDYGATWSERRSLIGTEGASDHPFLLTSGTQTYLSWQTADEGLRLIEIDALLASGDRR